MERPRLTKIEKKVYVAILEFGLDGIEPTREEIADKISDKRNRYSAQLVQYHLKNLEKKGYLEITPYKKGGIKVKVSNKK